MRSGHSGGGAGRGAEATGSAEVADAVGKSAEKTGRVARHMTSIAAPVTATLAIVNNSASPRDRIALTFINSPDPAHLADPATQSENSGGHRMLCGARMT